MIATYIKKCVWVCRCMYGCRIYIWIDALLPFFASVIAIHIYTCADICVGVFLCLYVDICIQTKLTMCQAYNESPCTCLHVFWSFIIIPFLKHVFTLFLFTIPLCIHIHLSICIFVRIYGIGGCTSTTYVYVYIYVYIHVCIDTYRCKYAYIYIYICIYIYI